MVSLEVILSNGGIRVQHNTKSLISYETKGFGLALPNSEDNHVLLYGPVKGLISIDCANCRWPAWNYLQSLPRVPIAVCNPFLGQLKLLPLIITTSSSKFSLCWVPRRSVAVGYDEDDFKVVQLSTCALHYCLHAHVYTRNTDSWRELAVDDDLGFVIVNPIKSACENGRFAHWNVYSFSNNPPKILCFDMKKEVFNTIKLDISFSDRLLTTWENVSSPIFAKDEHSFRLFRFRDKLVYIYETRCDGSKLSWNYVMNVEMPRIDIIPQWRTGFVVIENWNGPHLCMIIVNVNSSASYPKGSGLSAEVALNHLRK